MRSALPIVPAKAPLLLAVVSFSAERCRLMFVRAGKRFLTRPHLRAAQNIKKPWRGSRRRCNPCGFENRLKFPGAYHRIDFRNALANFVAIALHQAACNDQFLGGALSLESSHLKNRVYGFLLRGVDKAAGVHDKDVGLFGTRG